MLCSRHPVRCGGSHGREISLHVAQGWQGREDRPEKHGLQRRTRAARLSRHAADPPLRGKGRPALRHGLHRRLLPPLYRPGGRRRGHADGPEGGRPGHHLLPRPWPHAGLRHGPQGRHGRTDRAPRRLLQGQGRLDAHVQPREAILRRPRHRRRAGAARAQGSPSPTSIAATTMSRSPISATARPTRARSTRPSTWPRSGSCR